MTVVSTINIGKMEWTLNTTKQLLEASHSKIYQDLQTFIMIRGIVEYSIYAYRYTY